MPYQLSLLHVPACTCTNVRLLFNYRSKHFHSALFQIPSPVSWTDFAFYSVVDVLTYVLQDGLEEVIAAPGIEDWRGLSPFYISSLNSIRASS